MFAKPYLSKRITASAHALCGKQRRRFCGGFAVAKASASPKGKPQKQGLLCHLDLSYRETTRLLVILSDSEVSTNLKCGLHLKVWIFRYAQNDKILVILSVSEVSINLKYGFFALCLRTPLKMTNLGLLSLKVRPKSEPASRASPSKRKRQVFVVLTILSY